MSSISSGQRGPFFPRADAAVLQSTHAPPPTRPKIVGPVFDTENASKPMKPWSFQVEDNFYPPLLEDYVPASVPAKPTDFVDRYLYPVLTQNERLRVTMLWYYTRGILDDDELLSRLQEKVCLVQESIGWEFVIVGLLDVNSYTRLATYGLPLAILPRRESTCAHTVNQPAGSVFLLSNMAEDWRFQGSPHVETGGLRAYAGRPLRFETEFSEAVALGSLCVASNSPREPLTRAQQITLSRLADWIISDLVQYSRARRQRERRRMTELMSEVQRQPDDGESEKAVLEIVRTMYPGATVNLQYSDLSEVSLEGRGAISASDLEGGLWEDVDYIEYFIENFNHLELPSNRVIRVIAAQCEDASIPSFLVVASKDFRLVFDDVDAWFVQTCAGIISRMWHKRRLAEAVRAKERFLRGITHQLRTPIHGILGSVELLAEELKSRNLIPPAASTSPSPDGASPIDHVDPFTYIDTIKTSGRDLISVVNSMITLNRWADIAMTERVDALHTIRELEADLSNEIIKAISWDTRHKPSIFFRHELPFNADSLWIDSNLFKDSILPLALNAIQSASKGIVLITLSIHSQFQELVVDVEDSGCGIDLVDHKRIFDAYEKVDVHSPGAGLGLTLSSRFAELLNGSVELVSSNVGRGSHFRATFRDLTCACSREPQQQLQGKLTNMPLTFYRVEPSSSSVALSDYFTTFLTSEGFNASSNPEGSLMIFDYVSDKQQLRHLLSQISPQQVAICLVPASERAAKVGEISKNVIYVKGPFLTSTQSAALEQADAVLSEIKAAATRKKEPEEPSATETTVAERPKIQEHSYPNGASAVQSHSKVALESDLNDTVPLLTEPSPAILVRTSTGVADFGTHTTISKPVALLVDDNTINLRIMQMYCRKRGLSYHCAADGKQAVEVFSQHQTAAELSGEGAIELILMDLQMPVCDGIEATRQIRMLEEQNNWERSVLFIVTGQDSPSDRTDAESAGADSYFVKPVDIKLLDLGVRRYFPAFKTG